MCFANDDLYQKNKINNYKKKLINKNLLINTTGIYEEYLNKSSVDLFLIVITNQKNKTSSIIKAIAKNQSTLFFLLHCNIGFK